MSLRCWMQISASAALESDCFLFYFLWGNYRKFIYVSVTELISGIARIQKGNAQTIAI